MKSLATAAQHKKQNSYILLLLSQLGVCDESGFEVITNDDKMLCVLMANETYNNSNKCKLYSSSGSASCLRCIKAPSLRTISELHNDIRASREIPQRKLPNKLSASSDIETKGKTEMSMNWTKGYCPVCQPEKTGDEKSLLNGKCIKCLKDAKGVGSPVEAGTAHTTEKGTRTKKGSVYTPPEGFMLIRQSDILTQVMESAKQNVRTLEAEIEVTLRRGLAKNKPTVDFERLNRLVKRRKELGTNQSDPQKAYVEAFERIEMLIGDIQAGDL